MHVVVNNVIRVFEHPSLFSTGNTRGGQEAAGRSSK